MSYNCSVSFGQLNRTK